MIPVIESNYLNYKVMKNFFWMAVAMTLAIAGCSHDITIDKGTEADSTVRFSTYLGRTAET